MTPPLDTQDNFTASPDHPPLLFNQDHPLSPKGRFTRMSFLAWTSILTTIYLFVFNIVIGFEIYAFFNSETDTRDDLSIIFTTFSGWCAVVIFFVSSLVISILYILITIRRLHDMNRSGWLSMIVLIPVLGLIFTLYISITKGDLHHNQYGSYRATEQTEKFIAIIFTSLCLIYIAAFYTFPNILDQYISDTELEISAIEQTENEQINLNDFQSDDLDLPKITDQFEEDHIYSTADDDLDIEDEEFEDELEPTEESE